MKDNQNKSIRSKAKEKIQALLGEPKTESGRIRRRVAGQIGVTCVAVLMIGAILFALTSAWYTNTIQANEISLKTGKWNFDGTITLGGEQNGKLDLGELYPGDSRLLPVTIENVDSRGVNIRVEADKSLLSTEMQKRIYLYVEKEAQDGTKTRHYLNSLSGYMYAVGAGQTLYITSEKKTGFSDKQVQNGTELLHLQWTYDVTGYFLLGTVSADGAAVTGKTEDGKPEYLMPVTYDLDRAQFDGSGKLASVTEYQTQENGSAGYTVTSREDYLKSLFQQYAEEYNINAAAYDKAETATRGQYYAVDVDENGYGVWLYLADLSDIEKETAWDQTAAQNESAQSAAVKLVFKGQNQTTSE